MFTHRKFAIVSLFVFHSFLVNTAVSQENAKEVSFVKNDYMFNLQYSIEPVKRVVTGGSIRCGGRERDITLTFDDNIRMSIEDEHLTELLAVFGLKLEIGYGISRLQAMTELRNQFSRETRFVKSKGISTKADEKVTIKERPCFNQRVFILSNKKAYKMTATEKNTCWWDDTFEFQWEDYDDHHIVIEAVYDETCDNCLIQDKEKNVKGKDGEEVWVQIPYKNQDVYIIPLYWGRNKKLMDPTDLLPEDIRHILETD